MIYGLCNKRLHDGQCYGNCQLPDGHDDECSLSLNVALRYWRTALRDFHAAASSTHGARELTRAIALTAAYEQGRARGMLEAVLEIVAPDDSWPAGVFPFAYEPAEHLARVFHETYEHLAPHFGYETRELSRVPWAEVPSENRALMIATCAALLEMGRRARPAFVKASDDEPPSSPLPIIDDTDIPF